MSVSGLAKYFKFFGASEVSSVRECVYMGGVVLANMFFFAKIVQKSKSLFMPLLYVIS